VKRVGRRAFLSAATALITATALADRPGQNRRVKAIAFDAFPIIDPRPVAARAEQVFPGQGERLMSAWRMRQFEYSWLRSLGDRYVDFWQTTQDALVFAARSTGLTLGAGARDDLMHAYIELRTWPDVPPALERLRGAGIRLAFLSNFTAPMLDAALHNAGLRDFFGEHMSADRVRAFKPDPRTYALALQDFRAGKDEIVFCAAAGWDVAGATWFGYRTFWMNRSQQPAEELGVRADGVGAGMAELTAFVLGA
jgi:2-haloacid dehalogenase